MSKASDLDRTALIAVRRGDLLNCLEAASSYDRRIPREGHNEWAARLYEAVSDEGSREAWNAEARVRELEDGLRDIERAAHETSCLAKHRSDAAKAKVLQDAARSLLAGNAPEDIPW